MDIEMRRHSNRKKGSGSRVRWTLLCGFLLLLLSACGQADRDQGLAQVPDGDPERGRQAVFDYGCTSCHIVPGVPGPEGLVGPPLHHWADRTYIAGSLQNTPDNLIAWISAPQSIEPGTAMPNMGVTEQDARDMAAYLFTLRYDDGPAVSFVRDTRAFFENLFGGDKQPQVPVTGVEQTETPAEEATPEGTQAAETVQPEETPENGEQEGPSEEQAQALIDQGEGIYNSSCATCHQEDGQGQGNFPALAGNDFVTQEDPTPVIDTVLHGRGVMPSFEDQLSNEEIAAVVSYIRNAWENEAEVVTEQQVQAVQEGGSAGDVSAAEDDEEEPGVEGEETPQPDATPTPDGESPTPAPDADQEATPTADGDGQDGMTATATPSQVASAQLMAEGEELYRTICAACHQLGGVGTGPFPPLNGNPLVTGEDPHPVIDVVLTGRAGMPAFMDILTNRELTAIVTYIRGAWDNDASAVDEQMVEDVYQQIQENREEAVDEEN